jgi:hypothetical protein
LLQFWSDKFVGHDGIKQMAANSMKLTREFVQGMVLRKFLYAAPAFLLATVLAARRWPTLTAVLWLPFVLLFGASVAGRAPFGGGRTDIFLYPLAAVVVALATQELLRLSKSAWLGIPWGQYASVLAVGAVFVFEMARVEAARPYHREEDLAPLARYVMAKKQVDDLIVVGPWARFAWFLYSEQPFTIAPRERHPRGFPYTMDAKDTIVLDEFDAQSPAPYTHQLSQALAAGENAPPRIWLVISHTGYGLDAYIGAIREYLEGGGYSMRRREEWTGVFVELWIRSAP